MIITEDVLRGMIRQNIQETIDIKYMQKMTEELMPYFKDVVAEERRRLEFHMILEGYDPALLDEGLMDTIADIGITAGQMVGGGVGMAAGAIGTVKYAKEFQATIDKGYEWLSPLIGLFFSMQALVFPMPAVASIKVLLLGFMKGVKGIIAGTGGLAAKGVLKVFQMGAGWFGKAIGLLGKGIAGIGKAIQAGGAAVVKLGEKMGGGKMLESVVKLMSKKMDWLIQFLDRLRIGLKALGQTKITMEGAKTMLKNAFSGAGNVLKGTKAGQAVMAAKTQAGQAVANALKSAGFLRVSDDVASVVLKGTTASGKSLEGFKVAGILKGELHLVDDAGKQMVVGADAAAKLIGKHPALKKWAVSKLDDAGKAAVNTALGVSGSTTRAAGKALGAAAAKQAGKIPAYFTRVVGDSTKSANKWLMKYMTKNPVTLQRLIGVEAAGSVKGSKYIFQGLDDAGKVMLTANVKGGKLVAPFQAAVSPAQFFASYGKSFYGVSSKSPYLQQFIAHLSSFYPKQRAVADMARIINTTNMD